MRLLFVIHSLEVGGAERVTASLANHWVRQGWIVTIVTLASVNLDSYDLHHDVSRVSLDSSSRSKNWMAGLWQNLHRLHLLRKALRNRTPDVAVGMMTNANVLLALASWGLSTKTIGSERVHPPMHQLGIVWERLRRHTYGRLSAVTSLSSETASWLTTHTNARKVIVIPNFAQWQLPISHPRVNVVDVVPRGRKILLSVGRLEVQKGFDYLIEAFSALANNHAEWVLVIVGEGSLRKDIERRIEVLGLTKRVFLPGQVGNIGEWYRSADMFVLSSRFEGFPNTLIESMAHRLPVVSFDCNTGPRDIVRNNIDGLLVSDGNLHELIGALNRLMSDKELRLSFGTRATEVRTRYAMEKVVALWEGIFEEAMRE